MRNLTKNEINTVGGADWGGVKEVASQAHIPSIVGAGIIAGLVNVAFNAKFLVLIASGIGGATYLAHKYGSGWMSGSAAESEADGV